MSETHPLTILTGDTAVLARRYAAALYELASEAKTLDAVANELRGLKSLWKDSAEFRAVFLNKRLTRPQTLQLIDQIATTTGLSVLSANFLKLLARNRRLNLLNGSVDAFLAQLATARNEHTVTISTAQPLTPAQESQLKAELQKVTGGTVTLDITLQPALLGGLMIKLGSRQIDASLRGKLARLEQQLKTQREAA